VAVLLCEGPYRSEVPEVGAREGARHEGRPGRPVPQAACPEGCARRPVGTPWTVVTSGTPVTVTVPVLLFILALVGELLIPEDM
jgi:hypothetical protein